jgi:hypothetical protein
MVASQVLRAIGFPVDSSTPVSFTALFAFLGLFAFRLMIWGDSWRTFRRPQRVFHETNRTPFQLFMDAVRSCAMTVIFAFLLVAFLFHFSGRDDWLMLMGEWIVRKSILVVEVILQ